MTHPPTLPYFLPQNIYALVVVKFTRVPKLGAGDWGGGSGQFWQCQDFESTYSVNTFPRPTCLEKIEQ